MSSSCPFCHLVFPLPELTWHVNAHLLEDELERDMELAQQIALAPLSPGFMDKHTSKASASKDSENNISRSNGNSSGYKEKLHQDEISCLTSLQTKSTLLRVKGGFMALLKRCLNNEGMNSKSMITGPVDHFQSISADSGWGCGWRNIQMLSSHLLMQREEAREVIFGGSGFVPDIPALQRWLEIAWQRGFDTVGADSFNHKIYGSKKWIGATECATLFRSFGLRARIVDFDGKPCESLSLRDSSRGRRNIQQVFGPMDKFLGRKQCDVFQDDPFQGGSDAHASHNFASGFTDDFRLQDLHKYNNCTKSSDAYQKLVDWVWEYFASDVSGSSADLQHVLVSGKTPLYFQHDGHSRTIIGIQRQEGLHGSQSRYNLLILDPSQKTKSLEWSLRENNGWQKLIKRGIHTLKKPQYQLCYIDPGIAEGEELEHLKTIDSALIIL